MTNEILEAEDTDFALMLLHDQTGWRRLSIPDLVLMGANGVSYELGEARVNGAFAVGILRLEGKPIDEDTPWAVAHCRSGVVFGLWKEPGVAEIHADTIAQLHDWSEADIEALPDDTAEVVALVPEIIVHAIREGMIPIDPRFPVSNTVH